MLSAILIAAALASQQAGTVTLTVEEYERLRSAEAQLRDYEAAAAAEDAASAAAMADMAVDTASYAAALADLQAEQRRRDTACSILADYFATFPQMATLAAQDLGAAEQYLTTMRSLQARSEEGAVWKAGLIRATEQLVEARRMSLEGDQFGITVLTPMFEDICPPGSFTRP